LIGSGRTLQTTAASVILTGDTAITPDMRKVIDLECDLPPVENGNPAEA
jgi:hypothetical protein